MKIYCKWYNGANHTELYPIPADILTKIRLHIDNLAPEENQVIGEVLRNWEEVKNSCSFKYNADGEFHIVLQPEDKYLEQKMLHTIDKRLLEYGNINHLLRVKTPTISIDKVPHSVDLSYNDFLQKFEVKNSFVVSSD